MNYGGSASRLAGQTEGLKVWGQPELHKETPSKKEKKKKEILFEIYKKVF